MPADEHVLRAARNAFLVVLLTLVGIGAYQFLILGSVSSEIAALWLGAVVVYFGSSWYYRREDRG